MNFPRCQILIPLLLIFSSATFGEAETNWDCYASLGDPTAAFQLRVSAQTASVIFVKNVTETEYKTKGLSRFWDWSGEDGNSKFRIEMSPDGKASYFEAEQKGTQPVFERKAGVEPLEFRCSKKLPSYDESENISEKSSNLPINDNQSKTASSILWARLSFDMTARQAEEILGKPLRKVSVGNQEMWYYSNTNYAVFEKKRGGLKYSPKTGGFRPSTENGESKLVRWEFRGK